MDSMHTRRIFLARGLTILSAASTLPAFIQKTAEALNNPADSPLTQTAAGRGDDRILVIVQLAGGNDGLSTVIPVDNDDYRNARPTLAVTQNLLSLGGNSNLALHPNLQGFKSLYDAGQMSIVLGAGYPNPNRSHFRSTEIWQTADPVNIDSTGWMGRYFDAQCSGQDPIKSETAISIGSLSPMTLKGDIFQPTSLQNPQNFQWLLGQGNSRQATSLRKAYQLLNGINPKCAICTNTGLNFLQRTALDAELSGRDIRAATEDHQNAVSYPNSQFANSLSMVARMIIANMPTRVYYVSISGFDTHAAQQRTHDNLMTELSDGLTAFINDLKASGNIDRTLVVTFSEFGRRVAENASAGTDHGTAAPMFVFGGSITPGLLGAQPSVAPSDLSMGDLKFTTDFRCVYTGILQDWLGTKQTTEILDGQFKPVSIVKA
ncbi:MAG TPA: DUF1501 domain-containing protein [Phycisphaerae bacterium]|nr:DUF1501 domain-containing protein [Phycisphaerae bacterium]